MITLSKAFCSKKGLQRHPINQCEKGDTSHTFKNPTDEHTRQSQFYQNNPNKTPLNLIIRLLEVNFNHASRRHMLPFIIHYQLSYNHNIIRNLPTRYEPRLTKIYLIYYTLQPIKNNFRNRFVEKRIAGFGSELFNKRWVTDFLDRGDGNTINSSSYSTIFDKFHYSMTNSITYNIPILLKEVSIKPINKRGFIISNFFERQHNILLSELLNQHIHITFGQVATILRHINYNYLQLQVEAPSNFLWNPATSSWMLFSS